MSLQAPKSFFGGTFFGGEFFEQKAYGQAHGPAGYVPIPFKTRPPSQRDLQRSRGQFQVLITAGELIELVASRHLDDEDLLSDLKREFAARFMEWLPEYAADARRERARLVAERDQRRSAEAKALDEWLKRRQKQLRH